MSARENTRKLFEFLQKQRTIYIPKDSEVTFSNIYIENEEFIDKTKFIVFDNSWGDKKVVECNGDWSGKF